MKIVKALPVGTSVSVQPLKNLHGNGAEILAKEVLKTVGSTTGGVFITTTSWSAFQATHTLSQKDILQGLMQNGVTADKASTFAGPVHDLIKSDPSRLLFVAVTGGGIGITILEATRKFNVPWRHWSQPKILLVGALSGAVVLSGIYLLLKYYGIAS